MDKFPKIIYDRHITISQFHCMISHSIYGGKTNNNQPNLHEIINSLSIKTNWRYKNHQP